MVLARAGYRVVIIEATGYDRPRVGETLPPSGRPLLAALGVWDAVVRLGPAPSFANQSAWGSDEISTHPFLFDPCGSGWHIDRKRFDALLAHRAVAAGARILDRRRVVRCTLRPDRAWCLTLADDERRPCAEIIAPAIIEASGRRAALAPWLGGRRRVRDRLVGVAAELRGCGDSGHTLVEAVQDGWWYSAPIPGGRMMVMFMTDADLCHARRCGDAEAWRRHLARTTHTARRLADAEVAWGPSVISAVSHRLERVEPTGRWLAAGDAAMGVDPLSSSGIVRALTTGQAAAHAMAHWLQGRLEPVDAYERSLDAAFSAYWRERNAYYRLEQRWPDAVFWQRRTALATAAPNAAQVATA